MNNDSDTPLTPVGDDALEARIVAWVLGEASAFEAAELEKLCAADPALRSFERRIRDLHVLIGEDMKARPDPAWQLSAARREKITDLLGVTEVQATADSKVNRYFTRRILLAAAACFMISLISYSTFWESSPVVGPTEKRVDFMPSSASGGAAAAGDRLETLRRKIREQEDAVEDKRKLLSQVIRQEGVIYRGEEAGRSMPTLDPEAAQKSLLALQQDKVQLESQVDTLLKFDGEQLSNYASGLSLPDNVLPKLLPQYQEQKREYEALKSSGLASNHPTMEAQQKLVDSMERDVVDATANLRETLKAKLELKKEQVARLEDRMAKNDGAVKEGIAAQVFSDAKGDFEASQRALDQLKAELIVEEVRQGVDQGSLAMGQGSQEWKSRGAPQKPADTKYSPLWSNSPYTRGTPPPASIAALPAEPELAEANVALGVAPASPAAPAAVSAPQLPELAEAQSALPKKDNALAFRGAPPAQATAFNDIAPKSSSLLEDVARGGMNRDFTPGVEGNLPSPPIRGMVDPSAAESEQLADLEAADGFASGGGRADVVTGGLRSRDVEATRNYIDAVQEPQGHSGAPAEAAGIAAGLGATVAPADSLGAIADLGSPRAQGEMPIVGDPFGSTTDQSRFAWSGGALFGLNSQSYNYQLSGKQEIDAQEVQRAQAFFGRSAVGADASSAMDLPADSIAPLGGVAGKSVTPVDPAESDKLRDEGREAYAKGDYETAVQRYRASLGALPERGDMQDRRAYANQLLADGAVALGEKYRKVGKYEEARQLANEVLAADASNTDARRLNELLDDPSKSDLSLSYQTPEQADKLRRALYTAEGAYNLGKYDEATKLYEDAIRIDPYDKAARRGIAKAAMAKQDYYRAAHDHTRAELLAQVDEAWELSVPPKQQAQGEPQPNQGDGYTGLAQKEMLRRQNAVVQSDALRDQGREATAKGDFSQAVDKYKEALKELPDAPMVQDRRAYLGQLLSEGATALGEQYRNAGELAKVRELAIGVLAVDPGNAGAKTLLQDKDEEKSDETSATDNPFSTFSLHVSDASFKLAKAALDRGEQPDPAGIRPEEFYNAFDYGDPAPGRGEPVACAVEQAAHPAAPQRNLVRIGVRTGSQGRGQSTPLNLTILLDSSGSMEREDRHAGITLAMQQLAGLLKEGDTVSVIGFSRQPRLLADRLPGSRAQELNALIAQTPSEGGTNLEEGLKLAEELAKRQFNAAAQNRVVLFTDGAANLGDAQPESLQARIEAMRQGGIAFDAAGFGADGLNDKLLERLTRNGNGRYYIVDRPEDADANFAKQLAGAFRPAAENVKVQVRFNPARVGKYKLIGFEEHRLNKEDFRNDAVDAAEMAAEEAGIALYQVEPLPGGEGEIGEVSVRFRDAASGQMVERTWTIPYEAQAPAFDQAAPSIQLAGLAAFSAEKLRKAPLSDAIDFQKLGPILGKVKARYPNSQAVSDLDAMIGKLR